MSDKRRNPCAECADGWDRRRFMAALGSGLLATAGVSGVSPRAALRGADEVKPVTAQPTTAKPAESLIQELFATLSDEQKQQLVFPYNHGMDNGKGFPTRLGMYNNPVLGRNIGKFYLPPQQELLERILKAISSGEEGYKQLSRNGRFDTGGNLQGCGAVLFGDPTSKDPYVWMFSGHHLTVRCDGNTQDLVGFGGPLYYGHSPNGYSEHNVFNYQTKSVKAVYDALDGKQRGVAEVSGSPGEHAGSVKFREAGQKQPGIPYADLSADQQKLVAQVMRDILSPFRKEEGDEVMRIIAATGGMEKIHLAFYRDGKMDDNQRWHFWRLEGPGFIWNYRVLPHVHCYVNIASNMGQS